MGRYSKPVHKHKLVVRKKEEGDEEFVICGGCKSHNPGQTLSFCTICSSYFHEECANLPLGIKHFFHPCRLSPHILDDNNYCNACSSKLDNVFAYRCWPCDFNMCVKCATTHEVSSQETESVQICHCCHPHPLQQLHLEPDSLLSCEICRTPCSLGQSIWGCQACSFQVHKYCIDFLPETLAKKKSPPNKYSRVLKVLPRQLKRTCFDCKYGSTLIFYNRRQREKFLCITCCLSRILDDESSSEIPRFISHFFHPCPELKLVFCPASICNACFLNNHKFFYHCYQCGFFLCYPCAQLPKLLCHENEVSHLVQHFCHWHPLKLLMGTQKTNIVTCNLCERSCSEPFYGCNDHCPFYIHKSCMDSLPQKTNHPILSQTIVLLPVPFFDCTTCNRQCYGLSFYCYERKCKFCVKCVLWPENVYGNAGRFTSARHWHILSLCEIKKEEKVSCYLCKECCIGWSYNCNECAFFFHKSCAELPTEVDHPSHPQHSLTLTNWSSRYPDAATDCKLCLKRLSRDSHPYYDWVYMCHPCNFQLDIKCAFCLPSLEYDGHPHFLYLVVNMYGDKKCKECRLSCDGSTLRCADEECYFNLHLHCGPLPRTIKHACHVHPLSIRDYYVEDNISDEFACHVCEEERNPRLRVYCCSEGCLMICEVRCAASEVVPLLRGERGEVELITPFPQVGCRVFNSKSNFEETPFVSSDRVKDGAQDNNHVFSAIEFMDFISNNSHYDEKEDEEEAIGIEILFGEDKPDDKLKSVREDIGEAPKETDIDNDDKVETRSVSETSSITYDPTLDEEVKRYSFSWNALTYFQKMSHRDTGGSFRYFTLFLLGYSGSVMTGTYALPQVLDPIYDELFGMYNIFDDKCNMSYRYKRFLVLLMCGVLHQMWTTKVVDVKKERIDRWLGCLRYFKEKGIFNVGFIEESIKKLWSAHYYIESMKIIDDKSLQLREKIDKKARKIEELRTRLAKKEARLKELQLEEDEHIAYRVAGSRGPMKKMRDEALEIKWRTCYDALVKIPLNEGNSLLSLPTLARHS